MGTRLYKLTGQATYATPFFGIGLVADGRRCRRCRRWREWLLASGARGAERGPSECRRLEATAGDIREHRTRWLRVSVRRGQAGCVGSPGLVRIQLWERDKRMSIRTESLTRQPPVPKRPPTHSTYNKPPCSLYPRRFAPSRTHPSSHILAYLLVTACLLACNQSE